MTRLPLCVVVTGSECTGKSTLAEWLAASFDAPRSAEYARQYVDTVARTLTVEDVEPIARGQQAGEDAAGREASALVIRDTDLLSTVVYSRHYYGHCPEWIARAARERLGDLYLLLSPDVPWVADGLQRDRPGERERIHQLFRAALLDEGARVVSIAGPWAERYASAEAAVRRLLAGPWPLPPDP